MPVSRCKEDGKPGYRWGTRGKCYTYDPKNEQSKKDAKAKAFKQGIAVEGSPEAAQRAEQAKARSTEILDGIQEALELKDEKVDNKS